ncbi:MAG: GSCFA domain-containing protein [Bacteroidales bacterium]|jgi:hypothetical protein|nr:GSCFA domain-containing protein [Bacteroidales bacterium]
MKLLTEVNIAKAATNISHKDSIMLLGSCFSQNIGEKLSIGGFRTLINPFGTMYNPFSIAESLDYIMFRKDFNSNDTLQNGDVWKLIPCHGEVFGYSQTEVLEKAKAKQAEANSFLNNKPVIVLTLGTAFVYTLIKKQRIMANCHKINAKEISKGMMSVTEITDVLSVVLERLKEMYECRIIITVSPVRHWREGFRDNLLSKSTLHLAVAELEKKGLAEYFPAYEVVFDQLRDYRYYSDDLLHPNNQAIEVIWNKFSAAYFDETTINLCRKCEKLHSMRNHRPLYPQSVEWKQHIERTLALEKEIENDFNKPK